MKTGDVTSIPEFVPDDSSPFSDPYELVDTLYMQLINEDSLAEMFHIDKGYGCGTYIYKAYNLYAGNHPGRNEITRQPEAVDVNSSDHPNCS